MTDTQQAWWQRFAERYSYYPEIGLSVDLSRAGHPPGLFELYGPQMAAAFGAMAELEKGAMANPDEDRRVGHYWLRCPELAPETGIRQEIDKAIGQVEAFAADVHAGRVQGAHGPFRNLLVIGIGGSALGPQFVASALGHPKTDKLRLGYFDNTDPDGMDRVLAALDGQLGVTLCVVISKSGGTKETANGEREVREAYRKAGLDFTAHAIAVTMPEVEKSRLAARVAEERWKFGLIPIWDWVGGRTSVTSAVGLLPAALQGLDIRGLLAGARACDAVTRVPDARRNPAAQLAVTWHLLGNGRGEKDMVVIPYKDRLELFSRYLQQLVMESLGKELDLQKRAVHQGIAVYGNKGSTDQHAYVQQLRDGVANFFVVFIEVLRDRQAPGPEVETGVTSGDYLSGYLLGTRSALYEKGRPSLTLTVPEVSAFSVGVLVALFERAVGFYASLVNINAYHQPGVQAGKEAAEAVLRLQHRVRDCLARQAASGKGGGLSVEEIVRALGGGADAESVFKICEHLAANPGRGVRGVGGHHPRDARYTGE
ncbi:MAG TPA: glucose-6-phosphate isomerase [Verrucomicrobiota bacterium]|nr:glucose-6-phosphate isomerase [Verrucomicrobiota bacterium]HNU49431.1 glucose-6-phosphate isomerase [Verrucomicrobiota bacterium]